MRTNLRRTLIAAVAATVAFTSIGLSPAEARYRHYGRDTAVAVWSDCSAPSPRPPQPTRTVTTIITAITAGHITMATHRALNTATAGGIAATGTLTTHHYH
jgi:hypothetical protein